MPLIKNFIRRLIRDGVADTCRHGRLRVLYQYNVFVSRRAERRYGLDCFRHVDLGPLGIVNPECNPYEPTDWLTFREFMKRTAPKSGDVFLDLGSGMGWVAVMAAAYPFQRVIGVEISPQLNAIAERNLNCVRQKLRCKNIQFVTSDATAYAIPHDVSHIYIYNSFRGNILRQVFQNIRQSLLTHPRKCVIMFKNTVNFERDVGPCDWLLQVATFKSRSTDGNTCVILKYESSVVA
jgi:SAM-dependent methyltransferase